MYEQIIGGSRKHPRLKGSEGYYRNADFMSFATGPHRRNWTNHRRSLGTLRVVHDFILFHFFVYGRPFNEILDLAFLIFTAI